MKGNVWLTVLLNGEQKKLEGIIMTSAKRIIIATLIGVCCGIVCITLAGSGGNKLPGIIIMQMVISRTLMGFVIGISAIKMNWALNGILLGFLMGLPMALSSSLGAEGTDFTPQMMFFSTLIIGAIYGFVIEFFTTVIFKAKQLG
ncbi:MAG: hypothetical protein RAO94_06095 [Candidatus Stygibacter australis]|nr:hypothetical protein [Candidatus Stygibacter australis]